MIPRLQVLVCTVASRYGSIDFSAWPAVEGVEYLVACQNTKGASIHRPQREDVDVLEFDNIGLSVNRNQALEYAVAPYVLIADDDTSFIADGLRKIIEVYDADPTLDYATFHALTPQERIYPPDGYDLRKEYHNYFPISFEISFRRTSLLDNGLRFSELAGIGAPYLCAGEEDLLLYHCRQAGLKGRYFNTDIVEHPSDTTSVKMKSSPAFLRTKGAVMRVKRGFFGALIRIPIESHRANIPFVKAFRYLMEGYIYSIRNNRLL